MAIRRILILVVLLGLLAACDMSNNSARPTATATQRGALVPTRIPTETNTPTLTPSHTPTLKPSATPSHTPTPTPSLTPSLTPTLTPTLSPTAATSELMQEADALLEDGQNESAIELYTQILRLNPNDASALLNRGVAYFREEEQDAALADFQAVLTLEPENNIALYNVGYIYVQINRYTEAIEVLTHAIAIKPDDYDNYTQRGDAYYYLGDFSNAIADFTRAIEGLPDAWYPVYSRGYAYGLIGEIDLARADFERYVEIVGEDNIRDEVHVILDALDENVSDLRPALGVVLPEVVDIGSSTETFTQEGNLHNPIYDNQFTFDGRSGDTITAEMRTLSGDLDPLLILYDDNGNEVARNDDDAETTRKDAAIREFVLPRSGVYTLMVTRFQQNLGTTQGDYILVFQRTEGDGTTAPADGELQCGMEVSGTITNDQYEVAYRFAGTENAVIGVEMNAQSGGLDAFLNLLSEKNEVLVQNDDDPQAAGGAGDAFIREFRLPETGVYIIIATRFQGELGSSNGDFTLRLDCE